MNAYVDSSVVLRVVLGELDRLPSWHRIDLAVSSELVRVECLRTLDRARIQRTLADEALSRQRADMFEALDGDVAFHGFGLLGSPNAAHAALTDDL